MRVTRIRDIAELRPLREAWNRLTADVPFRTWQWVESCWLHFGASTVAASRRNVLSRELCILVVHDAPGQLVGAAPLYIEHERSGQAVLRLLGDDESCSDYLGLLSTPRNERRVVQTLADWLTGEGHANWDLLELIGIDAEEDSLLLLSEALAAHGATVHQRGGLNCWRLELPRTWDEYLARISKSHRKQIRRAERQFFQSGRAEWHTVRSEEDLNRAFPILVDLHQRRRRSLGQAGLFSSPAYAEFQREAAGRLLAQDMLRLHWLSVDGQPVSAEYNLAGRHIVYGYQSGLEPAALEIQPGRLSQLAAIRQAIEEGFRHYDFLRGDEPYKAHWRAQPRATLELRVVPDKAMARIRHGLWLGRENVKHWVKAGLQIASPWS